MKIKTYQVSTLSEAISQIKRDLGAKAVILSTRKLAVGDKWWRKNKNGLEVTAAIDYNEKQLNEYNQKTKAARKPSINQPIATQGVSGPETDSLRKDIDQIKELLSRITPDLNFSNTDLSSIKIEGQEDALINSTLEEKPKTQKSKHVIKKVFVEEAQSNIQIVCNHLLKHYVDPFLIQELSDYLIESNLDGDLMILTDMAMNYVLEKLPQPENLTNGYEPKGQVFALVGPTGSGKTTTLAKIASQKVIDEKKSVGFISLDHFRIGAHEQLQRYSEILNIPFFIAQNKEELKDSISKMKHLDYIFIDTTGRSPKDFKGIKELEEILNIDENVIKSLVIPANINPSELTHAMDKFGIVQYSNLIMTKLDETSSFGNLFNATFLSGLPLSYFTIGQEVPEDIELASNERIVSCLFRELLEKCANLEDYTEKSNAALEYRQ